MSYENRYHYGWMQEAVEVLFVCKKILISSIYDMVFLALEVYLNLHTLWIIKPGC